MKKSTHNQGSSTSGGHQYQNQYKYVNSSIGSSSTISHLHLRKKPIISNITATTKSVKNVTILISMTLSIIICISILSSSSCSAAPIDSNTGAMMYLSQFGWLDPSAKNPDSAALVDMRSSIKEFQNFAGINATGELDDETLKLMSLPRCGVRDKIGHGDARRKKRYALQGSRWKVRELTYRIIKHPSGIRQSDVEEDVDKAFKVWEDVTNLSFKKQATGKVHIEIAFERGEHGDGDAFDGEGGTLAHAYFPVYGGNAHFDADEQWSVRSYRGTNIFQVAAHEFGHSLGLSHSDIRSALMAPFYRGYQAAFKLDQDDILAIQALYGKKQSDRTTTRRPTTRGSGTRQTQGVLPSEASKLCRDPKVDSITTMADGFTYVFKGSDFYRLTDNGVALGYPRKISSEFGSLPSNIDSAFTWTNDKTYFFKGSQYWRFTDLTMDAGYPKGITEGFQGIPNNIDTAFVWSGNGKIYFFKGSVYWRFDPTRNPPVSSGYPKPISNWDGIPNNLDAALRYSNGYSYFFKGNKYWRFNDRNFAVDAADPAFPRPVTSWWFGCESLGTSAMKTSGDQYDQFDSDDNETASISNQ